LCTAFIAADAQKVYTKNGSISFFSKASVENISAENSQVTSILTLPGGDLQFSVLIKAFHFKKSMMEEHFNENYLESDKYPKATFKGKINDPSKVNFAVDGTYPVQVSGDLMIHGITNNITAAGIISVKSGVIKATSTFKVKLADYKISIPSIVKDNIAEIVDVTVSCVYDQKI
jgi:hypothetical protein